MPLRPIEKGRQQSGVSTRSASQERSEPLMTAASAPPTMARSTAPERIICRPTPIAWLAEEQALAMAKVGPLQE